jgi:hypothetical protein
MNTERRRALEKELQDILKITNPLVPATLDPNSPTAMSVPEVESAELDRLRTRRDEIQQMLDDDSSEDESLVTGEKRLLPLYRDSTLPAFPFARFLQKSS